MVLIAPCENGATARARPEQSLKNFSQLQALIRFPGCSSSLSRHRRNDASSRASSPVVESSLDAHLECLDTGKPCGRPP
jgi:hypothetical protein